MQNGANGIRTHDLLHAMQALSQLSYGPRRFIIYYFLFLSSAYILNNYQLVINSHQ